MKSPKPPDPYKTAAAQQGAEIGAAGASSIMNNPNIVNPYGTQSYSISGWEQVPDATGKMISVPRYTQTQTLSPDQMKLLGYETQAQANLGQTAVQQSAKMKDYLNKGIDTSKWQAWNAGPQAANLQKSLKGENYRQDQTPTDRKAIEAAMMQNYTQDTAGQNAAQDAQLAARGLSPGSSQYGGVNSQRAQDRGRAGREAYLSSGNESRAAQDAYNQVAGQRFGQTAQQGQFANDALLSMFNMGGQAADRGNAMRGAQAQEAFGLRNQPINEIAALMSGSQVTLPQFAGYQGQGISSPNIMGAVNNQYNQQAQQSSAFNNGLFSLLGAGVTAWSDRRLKKDIHPIRGSIAGVPLYRFRYRFDPGVIRVGVMADEAILRYPDVVTVVNGYQQVDYDRLRQHERGANP